MDWLTIFGLALALAMDAFAVALGVGINLSPLTGRHLFRLGFHFGLFQALMPIFGWLAGMTIQRWIQSYDHWVAFALLIFVGGKMLYEAFHNDETNDAKDPTRGLTLIILSLATSIDALAVGLSLAMLNISIWTPALVIGLVAGILTVVGLQLGRRCRAVWGKRVEIFGGLVLCTIGTKILLQHLLVN